MNSILCFNHCPYAVYRRLLLLITATLAAVCVGYTASPYAKVVIDSRILNGNKGNRQANPAAILGAPDGVEVSLGGPGAFIIVDMGEATPIVDGPGADFEVREIGDAFGGVDESYVVSISNSTSVDSFVEVGVGRAFTLFDIVHSGLASARYLRIVDLATETLDTTVPGSDIDSITTFHYSALPLGVVSLQVRLTGQGVLLLWEPPSGIEVQKYIVRRSIDGVSYTSSAYAQPSSVEHGYHDATPADVSDLWYSVSVVSGGVESAPAVAHISSFSIPVMSSAVHLGDNQVADWQVPLPSKQLELSFNLSNIPEGPEAKLSLDLFDVDYAKSVVLVNGVRAGTLPVQPDLKWVANSVRFPAGVLVAGANTVTVLPRDSSGAASGNLDDFMLRSISLHLYAQADVITLPWVVSHTSSLSEPSWTPISEPIRWNASATNDSGFFRLERLR